MQSLVSKDLELESGLEGRESEIVKYSVGSTTKKNAECIWRLLGTGVNHGVNRGWAGSLNDEISTDVW